MSTAGFGVVMASSIVGDFTDDNGNLLLGAGLDAATSGLGPAIRRYITSGVYNSDFALTPPYPDSTIVQAWNPLPFWTFTQVSGTSITAQSVADSASGSGRVLEFSMAAGAAGDDSYFEQIIPINASRSRSYAYMVHVSFLGGPTVSAARVYVKAAYLTNDGATVTGDEAAIEFATSVIGVGTVDDRRIGPGTTSGSVPTSAPSDAYYIRLRIGYKRHTEPTTTSETVSVLEAAIWPGPAEITIADADDPTTPAGVIIKQSDVLYVIGSGSGTPYLGLNNTTDGVEIGGSLVGIPSATQALVAGTTISPSALVVPISATAPITLTSAPTVSNGTNGQLATILNVGSNAITIQDQGTLASSNLRLATSTFAIGPRDSITLLYNSTIGDWVEIARTNVL